MKEEVEELLSHLNEEISSLSALEGMKYLAEEFSGQVTFSTSLGLEDQVLTDIIFKNHLPIRVFTLDTGRHFEETYEVLNMTNIEYKKKIEVIFPDHKEVENLLTQKGPFSFYDSVESRKECCHVRKVLPLKRALSGYHIWITGIRSEQNENRKNLLKFEWDESNVIIKYHPILNWSLTEVQNYISENKVPVNSLHQKGYPSIGCAPCTRAVKEGEDIRSGRWYWEKEGLKECGLHLHS
ncbi:MAG: phosphoadenylyl-sulfate reductase [Leptospiraceae bacterium]|nr:phosphoadenylyl-sulfate reductase [Leptospiraceae bacterium]